MVFHVEFELNVSGGVRHEAMEQPWQQNRQQNLQNEHQELNRVVRFSSHHHLTKPVNGYGPPGGVVWRAGCPRYRDSSRCSPSAGRCFGSTDAPTGGDAFSVTIFVRTCADCLD
jgi:hypothetical protein